MRNKVLVATLFVCTIVCVFIADYVHTDSVYEQREQEIARYASLNADPHMLYSGYTVEQLGSGYEKPSGLFGSILIDIPLISQFPELPVGCEIVSAAAVLQYLGFEIDKVRMADYFECDDNFTYGMDDQSWGPDPREVFAGDPFGWGYGCFAPVVTKAMNKYFEESGSDFEAITITGINSADIEKLLDEGVPLIVWATQDMKPFNYRKPAEWYIYGTGEKYTWLGNSHTLVLCGYDSSSYRFMDCNDKDEITSYIKAAFLKRFDEAGAQCVAVRK